MRVKHKMFVNDYTWLTHNLCVLAKRERNTLDTSQKMTEETRESETEEDVNRRSVFMC